MLRLGAHSNYFLQNDFSKYGEDFFVFEKISNHKDRVSAEAKEMSLANAKNTYNIVKDKSVGGDIFTHNPRKEEIRKMRVNQMTGKGNHQYGKKKSKKMISRVKESNSKPVEILGIKYKSIVEASLALGIKETTIGYRLKSNSDKFKKWKYIKDV